ncbi:MAG TPA: NUDIX hydrolase [Planctomycetaceae bacterium]|nr:NUDIX hydrolase [Planctomycetaceae bacterium]
MAGSVVYRGRVFWVEVEDVTLPKGQVTEIAIVHHRPSVVLIPITDDGRIVMIQQYRHALKRAVWELPAGNVEAGELPEAAAARECEEEIGEVPSRVERVGAFFPTPGYCDEEMIFFRVSGLHTPPADSPNKPDADEDITRSEMSAAEAKAMVARGEIVDLKTAYALTLV